MSNAIEIRQEDFEREVVKADGPVLVDFWAPWCGPCRALAPTLDQLAAENKGRLKVVKLNIDENQELAAAAGIRSIPAVMLFADGQLQDTVLGAQPIDVYRQAIAGAIPAPSTASQVN